MKKKILVFSLLTALLLCVSLFSVGCFDDGGDKHVHSFSTKWDYDETHHWHSAICEHTSIKEEYGPHVMEGGSTCYVCGYERKELFEYATGSDGNLSVSLKFTYKIEKRIEIPSTHDGRPVTEIAADGFAGSAMETLVIPEGIKKIGVGAFNSCIHLSGVTIPESVEEICEDAFAMCDGIKTFSVGANVKEIGKNAFANPNLESIEVDAKNTAYSSADGIMFDKQKTQIVFVPRKLSGNIILPDGVVSFGETGFAATRITGIVVPESVKKIDEYAFDSCEQLKTVEIKGAEKGIAKTAFRNCTALEKMKLPFLGTKGTALGSTFFGSIFGLGSYQNHTHYLPETLKSVTIASGFTVYENAFRGCKYIEEIVLPDTIEEIGASAFEDCGNLKKVNLSDSISAIGKSAFKNCSSLTAVNVPDALTEIAESTFEGCANILSLDLPDNLTTIQRYAFKDCSSLTEITIPNGVTESGRSMLLGCDSLETVSVPFVGYRKKTTAETIQNAGGTEAHFAWIFGYSYASLPQTDPKLPDNLETVNVTNTTYVPQNAFARCKTLTDINMCDTITYIGIDAFAYCYGLTSETFRLPDAVETCSGAFFFAIDALSGATNTIYNEYENGYYIGSKTNPYLVLVRKIDQNAEITPHADTKINLTAD